MNRFIILFLVPPGTLPALDRAKSDSRSWWVAWSARSVNERRRYRARQSTWPEANIERMNACKETWLCHMSNIHATPVRSYEEPEDEHITTDQHGQGLWAMPGRLDAGRSGAHEQKSGTAKRTNAGILWHRSKETSSS